MAALGFAVETEADLERLAERTLPHAVLLGSRRGRDVLRWEDASGARMVYTVRRGQLEDALPSLSGKPGARLQGATGRSGHVIQSAVVDEDGEQVTALVAALEEGPLLPGPVDGDASIVALGTEITVHADDDAFALDPASLLGAADAEPIPRPDELDPDDPWPAGPLRVAAESFISYGAFAEAFGGGPPEPHARLHGTVLSAERRRNEIGGLEFIVARVQTSGFVADVCLAADEHRDVPVPGSVLGGEVYLVGSLPAWTLSTRSGDSDARLRGRLRSLVRRVSVHGSRLAR
jgi:hypothetical protein